MRRVADPDNPMFRTIQPRGGGGYMPGQRYPWEGTGGSVGAPANPEIARLMSLAFGARQPAPGGQQFTPQQLELARRFGLPPHAFPPQGYPGCCGE